MSGSSQWIVIALDSPSEEIAIPRSLRILWDLSGLLKVDFQSLSPILSDTDTHSV